MQEQIASVRASAEAGSTAVRTTGQKGNGRAVEPCKEMVLMKMRVLLTTGMITLLAGAAWAQSQPEKPTKETHPTKEQKKTEEAKSLKIGDKAPPLTIEKWIKGEPVTGFEKGKVYVVEFWATWCGPCVRMFPHLSALQKEYQDKGVTVIGTNIWERKYTDDTFDTVKSFVEKQGDKMSYRVAFDGGSKAMDKAFMQAAGRHSIPTAFIVNQEGLIAFIGHPAEIDRPLKQVVAGNYDLKVAALTGDVTDRAMESLQSGDFSHAITIIDEGIAKNSKVAAGVADLKFQALMFGVKDADKAYAWANEAADKYLTSASDAEALNSMAWTILSSPQITDHDNKTALKLAKKAVDLTNNTDGMIMDTLALAYSKTGDAAKAYETQKKAVELAKNTKGTDQATIDEMSKRLDEFEKAANEKK